MPGDAGRGYIDGNSTSTSPSYTYIDQAVACDEDGVVDTINLNVVTNGGTLRIGVGTLSGGTFTMRSYQDIDISGKGTGEISLTAPDDFTEFVMNAGDWIVFYSSNSYCTIDRTTTGSPLGYGAATSEGSKLHLSSFAVDLYSTRSIEFEFEGKNLPWDIAEKGGIDPSNLEEIDGHILNNIETMDDL